MKRFSDSHEEMTPVEQHGIQLRVATDLLDQRVGDYAFETLTAIIQAEELLAAVHLAVSRPSSRLG